MSRRSEPGYEHNDKRINGQSTDGSDSTDSWADRRPYGKRAKLEKCVDRRRINERTVVVFTQRCLQLCYALANIVNLVAHAAALLS